MVMMDTGTVVDMLCAAMCCVRVLIEIALSSTTYIFRRLLPFFVVRFCGKILSTNFSSTTVLLSSRLQKQHAHAFWGLIN
jgi:hypothetical protein